MRGRLMTLGLFLVLGASTTVAVAWASAAKVHRQVVLRDSVGRWRTGGRFAATKDVPYSGWALSRCEAHGAEQIVSRWADPGHSSPNLRPNSREDPPEPLIPSWASFLLPPDVPTTVGQEHVRWLDMRGWPLVAMWSLSSYDGPRADDKDYIFKWGLPLPSRLRPDGKPVWVMEHALPLAIRWPGFVVDAVFYAAVWIIPIWGGTAAVLRIRSWLRLRRQQCPRCGYPIGVSPVCTECGAALPIHS